MQTLPNWEQVLQSRLPLYGHRNWVVVADSAYPAQSSEGIETIVAEAKHEIVVEKVLSAICASGHVKATVYADAELMFVHENDAPGITSFRNWLTNEAGEAKFLPHEEIISKLDRAGRSFRVLIIKTHLTIPYTSIFFEMECSYWNADAEMRLRLAMSKGKKTRRPAGGRPQPKQ